MSDPDDNKKDEELPELAPVIDLQFGLGAAKQAMDKFVVDAADAAFSRLDDARGETLRALMDASGVLDMRRADLRGVDLSGEDLSGIDFEGADLTDANLRGCNLSGTNLKNAVLTGADFEGATGGELRDGPSMVVQPRIQ